MDFHEMFLKCSLVFENTSFPQCGWWQQQCTRSHVMSVAVQCINAILSLGLASFFSFLLYNCIKRFLSEYEAIFEHSVLITSTCISVTHIPVESRHCHFNLETLISL